MTTTSHEVGPTRNQVRSLPLSLWPEADRNAWSAACTPGARLKRGGSAGHLKPVTRDDHARHYGCFLDFLDRHGKLRSDWPAAANVTAHNVDAYLAELKGRVASTTAHGSICKLRRAAQYMAPDCNLAWLAEIAKDLAFEVRPRSKFHRLVLSDVLVEAGLILIQEAEVSPILSEIARARPVRNGLMLAVLGLCPIRRKNLTALEIGRSFQKVRGQWWILLTAAETKENRPDERAINELLTPVIDRYLDPYRKVLARTSDPTSALWLSSGNGAPMTAGGVRCVISATTLATVGVDVSPHLFRTSVASTAAILGGDNPYLASALLHHTDSRVTNTHYIRATSMSAAESFRQIVRQYEKK